MEDLETTKPYKVPVAEKIPVTPPAEEPKPEKKKDKVFIEDSNDSFTNHLVLLRGD